MKVLVISEESFHMLTVVSELAYYETLTPEERETEYPSLTPEEEKAMLADLEAMHTQQEFPI